MKATKQSENFEIRLAEMQNKTAPRPEYEQDAMEDAFEALVSAKALSAGLADNPSQEAVAIIFSALFNDARLNKRLIEEAQKEKEEGD
jgi:hypothetical protein